MRKKKAVEWNQIRAAERVFSLPEAALRCALSVVAMNIYVFTTLFMMDGIWPGIVLGGTGFLWVFSEILFCALGFELLLPFLNQLQRSEHPLVRRIITAGVALAGCIWIALRYWRGHAEELLQGGMTLAGKYMAVYNLHFHTAIKLSEGDPEQVPLVLTALVCLLIFLLWILAYLCGRKYLWAVMPLGIWLASMFVGVAPDWKSIIWFWIGLFFIDNISEMVGFVGKPLQNPRGRKEYSKGKLVRSIAALMFMMIVFLGVSLFGKEPSQKMVEKGPEFLAFERRLEQKLQSLGNGGIDIEDLLGRKKLRSKQTEYDGKVVLELTASVKPTSNLYLKNFQSGTYRNGGWLADGSTFEYACKQDGIDSKALQRLLSGWAYENQYGSARGDYEISYKGFGTDALYPYYVAMEDLEENKLSQDVLIGKPALRRKNSVHAAVNTVPADIYLGKYYQGDEEEERLWNWYSAYVQQHYTAPSEEIPAAQKMASFLYPGSTNGTDWGINEKRMQLAKLVAAQLSSYRYNLDMGQVPKDQDIVEYFLSKGRQGFCVHFATAGVQICRNLGIPARYCEGYVAKLNTFTEQDGAYTCEVEDNTAHAWVEIYLEHIGWVPVEMTPGYYGPQWSDIMSQPITVNPTPKPEEPSESMEASVSEDAEAESTEETEASEAETEESESETQQSSEPGSSEEQGTDSSVETGEDGSVVQVGGIDWDGEGTGDTDGSHKHEMAEEKNGAKILTFLKNCLIVIAGLLVLAAAGAFAYRFIRHKIKEYEEKIPRAIKRGRYKAAVLLTNQRLYRRLKREGVLTKGQPTDREYGEALKQRYCAYKEPVWDAYMATVKQAAFSDEPLTKEQAQSCFDLYNEICSTSKEEKET